MNDIVVNMVKATVAQTLLEYSNHSIIITINSDNGSKVVSSIPMEFCEKLVELVANRCADIADLNYNKGFCPVGNVIREEFELLGK